MKLYVYTIVAQKRNGYDTQLGYTPGVLLAENDDEAAGKCYHNAKSTYPDEAGYYGQDFVFFEVGSAIKNWHWD